MANLLPKKVLNGLINTDCRSIKELVKIDVIQVEALAAVCTNSQMAAYFSMTEKLAKGSEERHLEVSNALGTGRAMAVASLSSVLYEKALGENIRAA